jgi:hypothetical protein
MTDDREVILGGRKINASEPDQAISWDGQGWIAISSPKVMAAFPGPGPLWISGPITTGQITYPVDPQFTEIHLTDEPEKKGNSDGCTCRKCDTFYPYADPPEDEKEFTCWACRHGY